MNHQWDSFACEMEFDSFLFLLGIEAAFHGERHGARGQRRRLGARQERGQRRLAIGSAGALHLRPEARLLQVRHRQPQHAHGDPQREGHPGTSTSCRPNYSAQG